MIGGYRYALAAGAVCVVVALSGWGGYRLARGDCAARELEVARAYAAHSDAIAEFARQQSEDAAKRITVVRSERAAAVSRAERLSREIELLAYRRTPLPADSVRALSDYYDALFPGEGGARLPDAVRGAAAASGGGAGTDDRQAAVVGEGVPQPAR